MNENKTVEKPKICPIDDWKVVGWVHKGKSDKVLKIVLKDSEDKHKTLGVFFPQQISRLYTGEIRSIPIKYREKPKEDVKKELI